MHLPIERWGFSLQKSRQNNHHDASLLIKSKGVSSRFGLSFKVATSCCFLPENSLKTSCKQHKNLGRCCNPNPHPKKDKTAAANERFQNAGNLLKTNPPNQDPLKGHSEPPMLPAPKKNQGRKDISPKPKRCARKSREKIWLDLLAGLRNLGVNGWREMMRKDCNKGWQLGNWSPCFHHKLTQRTFQQRVPVFHGDPCSKGCHEVFFTKMCATNIIGQRHFLQWVIRPLLKFGTPLKHVRHGVFMPLFGIALTPYGVGGHAFDFFSCIN